MKSQRSGCRCKEGRRRYAPMNQIVPSIVCRSKMLKSEALVLAVTLALGASVVTRVPAQRVMAARPAPAHLKPRSAKAAPKAPIPLNFGDQVLINGILFTVTYGLAPASVTPPPPPPVPALTGYSPNPVAGGQPFSLLGTNFADASATATWNGQPLGLILTSPTTLSSTAPGVTAAATAPVILTTSGTRLVGPNLTVTPSSGPAPDLTVYGFRNSNRDYSNVFAPGQTVIIVGKGFGALAGSVSINHKRVPVDAWSDTEIRTTVPALDTGQGPGPATLDIIRLDHGSFNSSTAFVILPPPGRFGNR